MWLIPLTGRTPRRKFMWRKRPIDGCRFTLTNDGGCNTICELFFS